MAGGQELRPGRSQAVPEVTCELLQSWPWTPSSCLQTRSFPHKQESQPPPTPNKPALCTTVPTHRAGAGPQERGIKRNCPSLFLRKLTSRMGQGRRGAQAALSQVGLGGGRPTPTPASTLTSSHFSCKTEDRTDLSLEDVRWAGLTSHLSSGWQVGCPY